MDPSEAELDPEDEGAFQFGTTPNSRFGISNSRLIV